MKSKKIDIFIPLLIIFTFLVMAIESVSYIGYIRKFLFVDSRFILASTIVVILIYFPYIFFTQSRYVKILFTLNKIILFCSTLFYFALQFLEAKNFNNYIFSNYHIQPDIFFNIVLFSLVLFVFDKFRNSFLLKKKQILNVLVIFFLVYFTITNFAKTFNQVFKTNFFVLNHLNYNYGQKMTSTWGYYYDYMKFVKENTPEDAHILIPPQDGPWYAEGNVALSRYFVYPRRLYNGNYDSVSLNDMDYVMIAWGSWNIGDKNRYGWPKVKIDADYLLYVTSSDNSVSRYKENYDPNNEKNVGGWGLIKVKK